MSFSLILNIYVYIIIIIYTANALFQNKKQNAFLPKKLTELLLIPFYLTIIIAFFILDQNIIDIVKNKYFPGYNFFSFVNVFLGVILLFFSIIIYTYLNFFEKSFPSCIAAKNKESLSGIYKYLRHPSYYVFSFLTFGLSFVLQDKTLLLLSAINFICLWIYYLIEENQMVKDNPSYAEYLKNSNMFLPNFIKRNKKD